MEDSGSPDLGSNPRGTTNCVENYSSSVFLSAVVGVALVTSDMSPLNIENTMKAAIGKVTNARIGNIEVNPTIRPIGM
jgi:hypothetical protein